MQPPLSQGRRAGLVRLLPLAPLLLAMTAMMAGCAKNTSGDQVPAPIHTAAVVSLKYADSLKVVQDGVIAAQKAGTLSEDDTARILRLCIRLNETGIRVDTTIRGEVNLTPEQRNSVSAMIQPLADAVQKAIAEDVVQIQDPVAQQRVQAALVAIQTVIVGAETLLRMGGS